MYLVFIIIGKINFCRITSGKINFNNFRKTMKINIESEARILASQKLIVKFIQNVINKIIVISDLNCLAILVTDS